jgi:hypothetical protein
MMVVKGEERRTPSPSLYTHTKTVWGEPGALSATQDVTRNHSTS